MDKVKWIQVCKLLSVKETLLKYTFSNKMMWKLSETSVAIEASLHPNTENMCSLDGGEEAVCITMWLPVPWLLLGTINSFKENLKEAEIESYHNLIKIYDWHLPLPFWLQDNFTAAEVQNFTDILNSNLQLPLNLNFTGCLKRHS